MAAPDNIANDDDARLAELKAFDETKAGVQGLVEGGITFVPRIFHTPPHLSDHRPSASKDDPNFIFPIIDLKGGVLVDEKQRMEIVEKVKEASSKWGFFQVVNHGVPLSVMEEMKAGVGRFHEQDVEVKKGFFERDDPTKKVVYNSNFNLFAVGYGNWRDTLYCQMAPDPPADEQLPACSREIITDYSRQVLQLGDLIFQLLSEALGLPPNYLKDQDCAEGLYVGYHYYPACPQPELTLGASKHQDDGFLTVLLQDHIGGLQVLHQNHWVDVPSIPGCLVINIGDLLQMMSNDKFISVEHRVLANNIGPRISIASFFTTVESSPNPRVYGPIKELLSESNPPKYKETTLQEHTAFIIKNGYMDSALQGLLKNTDL